MVSWKTCHLDGKMLTNLWELHGVTFDPGKIMCIGTTMAHGQATNKHNLASIPEWSVHVMGPNMQKKEWQGICRTGHIRTVM